MFQECSDFLNNKDKENNVRHIQIFTLKITHLQYFGESMVNYSDSGFKSSFQFSYVNDMSI